MKDTKVIAQLGELLGLNSRAEIEHFLKCDDCDIGYEGMPELCWPAREKFRGVKRPVYEDSPMSDAIKKLWSQEILRQCHVTGLTYPSGTLRREHD